MLSDYSYLICNKLVTILSCINVFSFIPIRFEYCFITQHTFFPFCLVSLLLKAKKMFIAIPWVEFSSLVDTSEVCSLHVASAEFLQQPHCREGWGYETEDIDSIQYYIYNHGQCKHHRKFTMLVVEYNFLFFVFSRLKSFVGLRLIWSILILVHKYMDSKYKSYSFCPYQHDKFKPGKVSIK